MRLDSKEVQLDGKVVVGVRVDQIGGVADGLWWVAEKLSDGSAKPEGMFTSRTQAMGLANELAAKWSVPINVTEAA